MAKKNFLSIFSKGKQNKQKSAKPEQTKRVKKRNNGNNGIDGYHGEDNEENPQKYINTNEVGGRTRQMVLSYLNIDDNDVSEMVEKLAAPDDIESVEFTISVPSGLDVDEVTEFCDTMEADVRKYRLIISSLKKDKELLISEILRVDAKAMEQKQNNLIGAQLGTANNKAEKLQDDVVKLRFEVQKAYAENKKLKQQLKTGVVAAPVDNSLKEENENLRRQLDETSRQLSTETAKANERAAQELKKLQEQNNQLKAQLDSVNSNAIATNDEELSKLKAQLNQKTSELDKLKQEPNTVQQELDETKKKLQEALDVRAAAQTPQVDTKLVDGLKMQVKDLKEKLNDASHATAPDDSEKRILEAQVQELRRQLEAKPETVDNTAEIDSLKSKVSDLELKLAEEKRKQERIQATPLPINNPAEFTDSDEYEAAVMQQFANKKKSLKHVKKRLSPEDIKRMQAGEKEAKLTLGGNTQQEKKQESEPKKEQPNDTSKPNDIKKEKSSFDNLFDEMNED